MHRVIAMNKEFIENIAYGEKYGTKWLYTYVDV